MMPAPLYNILLESHLDSRWSEWLDNMTITLLESGETLLSGPLTDQAALHGLLAKIRDMNIIASRDSAAPIKKQNGGSFPFCEDDTLKL